VWLRSALRKQPRKYWESRLNIELSILDEEREATPPVVNTKPKLMNKTQQVEFIKKERLISECQQKHFDYLDYTSKWAEALTWTIRWHEGDPVNLPVTIKRAALSIYTVSEAFKVHLDKNDKTDFNLCFNKVSQVLGKLREAIQCNAADKGIVFQFLSPQNDFIDIDRPFKLRESIDIWDAIKELLPALASMMDFQKLMGEKKLMQVAERDKSDLENWKEKLRQRLRKGWKYRHFADIAADQQVFDILGNESMLCSHNKRGRPDCIYDKTNCAAETLLLGDPKSDSNMASTKTLQIEDTDPESDIPVASTDYLLTRMSRTDSEFTRFLEVGSLERRADDSKVPITPWTEFISLRRWNSFSPNLASRATTTVGGGYLVRVWNNEFGKYVGIAIDPGYNYLENLFDEGFTLPDLDVIVITHAHPDHVENLSNILTLLRERKSRLKKIRRVFLVLTEGVFQRFKTIFDNEVEFIEDVVVLSWAAAAQSNRNTVNVVPRLSAQVDEKPIWLRMGKKEEVSSSLVSIRAVPAIHADGTQYDSMGVVLRVTRQGDGDLCIGFTGDTRYTEELCIKDSFDDCDVLIPHIGSVIGRDSFSKLHEMWRLCDHKKRVDKVVDELQETLRKKNHLYLPGITMFLCKLKESMKKEKRKPLILLSEFGEELRGGLRADLAVRLHRIFGMTVLPADVGLRVGVEDQSVRCAICRQYVSADAVRPVPASDEDEALMFICIHCYNARKHELPILLSRLRNTPHEYHPANQSESHRG
jgi:ribonuclease BN (tRNA processing enzyme)